MVDMAAILNIVATVVSFVEGVVKNVSPLVSKYLDGKTHAPTTTTTPNPLCQLPRCNCSEDQLSSVCLQRRMSATSKNDDLPPISSSMPNESEATSSNSSVMLIFVGALALALVAFLCFRCRQQQQQQQEKIDDDQQRKSSTWTL